MKAEAAAYKKRCYSPLCAFRSLLTPVFFSFFVLFSEKQNWPYFIQEPHKTRIPPKSYAANYSYSPGKLRIHHTK